MGVINVLETFLCRYPEFSSALEQLKKPSQTIAFRQKGVGITANLNRGFQFMLSGDHDWMWIVDDGCVFFKTLLTSLLEHDVDVVVPFSLNDDYPHLPEIYRRVSRKLSCFSGEINTSDNQASINSTVGREPPDSKPVENGRGNTLCEAGNSRIHAGVVHNQDCTVVDNEWLKKQEGLVETELLVTNRGMLVRRNVIEAIQPPWCINAGLMPDRLGGDIYFCQQVLEAGFKIYIDFENAMGRFAHFSVWPQKIDDDWLAAVHKDIPWEA